MTTHVYVTPESRPQIADKYDPRVGSCPWFWMFMFGPMYLLSKGMVAHAFLWLFTAWTVVMPIFYILFARTLVYNHKLKRGELR